MVDAAHRRTQIDTRCCVCCGKGGCHIRTASLIIVLIELLLIVGSLIYSFHQLLHPPVLYEFCGKSVEELKEEQVKACTDKRQEIKDRRDMQYIYAAEVSINLVQFVIVVLLLAAICLWKPVLVIPHLVMQAITLLFLIIFATFLGLHGSIFFTILVSVVCVLELVFIYIVVRCFRWLRAELENRKFPVEQVQLQPTVPPPPPPPTSSNPFESQQSHQSDNAAAADNAAKY